ncbi:MAG: hypothetical protein C0601_07615 [Candidatus Muiribacterium halophilum]|uniref:Uncharacterized protein n=1 Tax=Muiribacterium halophilum TaxID=2053465 RepID=A0A2N5ZFK6_MUIH1|nr:MAG: hypothetical protein C0601_07615 [Candidatus Muirbacterium halophilum]
MKIRRILLLSIFFLTILSFADSVSFDSIVQKYDLKKVNNSNSEEKIIQSKDSPKNDKVIRFQFGKESKTENKSKNKGIEFLFDILNSAHENNEVKDKPKGKDYSNLFSYRHGELDISRRLGRIREVKQNRDKLLFIMSSGYMVLFSWSDYNTEFIYYSDDLMFNERIIDFEMIGSRILYLVFSRWSRIRVMMFDTFYGDTIINRVY